MVELLTDYTTQIYHALSTDARPDAEPGAQLREIDTGKRFIFDGSAWQELPDGGGGGGGANQMQLLASGTYTAVSAPNSLNIPVSFKGTACYMYLYEETILDNVGQVISVARCYTAPYKEVLQEYQNNMGIGSVHGYGVGYGRNSSNTKAAFVIGANSANLGNWTISNTLIQCPKYSPTYPWTANTYHWFIFGEA